MGISQTLSQFTALVHEWNGWLLNQRYIRRERSIVWDGFRNPGPRLPYHATARDLASLADSGQYSFQLPDGSLIQMAYHFDTSDVLVAASLLFCFAGEGVSDDDDVTEEDYEAAQIEPMLELEEMVPWIRIDYSPEHGREMIHNECHLHLARFPMTRMGVQGVPTPRQFVEAVTAWFFPDEYARRHLAESGELSDRDRPKRVNEDCLNCVDETCCAMRVLHMRARGD